VCNQRRRRNHYHHHHHNTTTTTTTTHLEIRVLITSSLYYKNRPLFEIVGWQTVIHHDNDRVMVIINNNSDNSKCSSRYLPLPQCHYMSAHSQLRWRAAGRSKDLMYVMTAMIMMPML